MLQIHVLLEIVQTILEASCVHVPLVEEDTGASTIKDVIMTVFVLKDGVWKH